MANSRQVIEDFFEYEGDFYKYSVKHSARAKNILLHVNDDGSVELVVPKRVSIKAAKGFVREQRRWILKVRSKYLEKYGEVKSELASGDELRLFGRTLILRIVIDKWRKKSSFGQDGNEVSLYISNISETKKVLERWYREQAREHFSERCIYFADRLGVKVNKVVVSSANSQWGSCIKKTGRISLQWRLALGPIEVTDYVMAHEIAHMVHSNHSTRFWQTVEFLQPDFKVHRAWLKGNGRSLRL